MDKLQAEYVEYCEKKYDVQAEFLFSSGFKNQLELDIVQFLLSKLQSRQAEVDEANAKSQMCRDEKIHAINRWSQISKELEEKDKRIDMALALIDTTSYSEINRRTPDFIDQLKNCLRGEP